MLLKNLNLAPEEYNKYLQSLAFIMKWETANGKSIYTNDPDDPGGETKWGISKLGNPDLDIAALTLEDASEIYYKRYWVPANCNSFEYPECLAVFDTAVNLGPGKARAFIDEPFNVWSFLSKRKEYYLKRVKETPKKRKFLRGWFNRVNDLEKVVEIYELTKGIQS